MTEFVKTLIGLAEADSRFDKVVVAAKEAVLVIVAAISVLQTAENIIQAFIKATGK